MAVVDVQRPPTEEFVSNLAEQALKPKIHVAAADSGSIYALIGLICGVAAVKAALVWIYAPMSLGDNDAFIASANQILAGSQWLSEAGLRAAATPPTLWRPIGYSLIIAGTKYMFGGAWTYALCAMQAMLSLAAGLLLLRLCLLAGLGIVAGALVFAFYEFSVPLSTDALIMEDAIIGALGTAALCIALKPVVEGRPPPISTFLVVGILAAMGFLIRDVFHFFMPIVAAGTFVLFAIGGRWRKGLYAAVVLAGPVALAAGGLQGWNYYRTGHAVTTTAGQTAYVYALLRAAKYDAALIGGPSVVETVLRENNRTFDYVDARAANQILFERCGMDSVAQAAAAQALFWRALFRHPIAFVKAGFERLRFMAQATLFASPLVRIDDLQWWAGGATEQGYRIGWRADALVFLQSRELSKLTIPVFFNLGIRAACQLLSLILFCTFLVGAPILWLVHRGHGDGPVNAAAIAWLLYGLLVCMYLPVSFEVRYLSPVIGGALFATAVVLCRTIGAVIEMVRQSRRAEISQ